MFTRNLNSGIKLIRLSQLSLCTVQVPTDSTLSVLSFCSGIHTSGGGIEIKRTISSSSGKSGSISFGWYKNERKGLRPDNNCFSCCTNRVFHSGNASLLRNNPEANDTDSTHDVDSGVAVGSERELLQNHDPLRHQTQSQVQTHGAEKTYVRLCQMYPQLQDYPKDEVIRYLEFMSSYAIVVDNAVEMLLAYPKLLKTHQDKITSTMATFRGVGLSENQRKEILLNNPGIVELPRRQIMKRVSFLKSYLTNAESIEIIVKSRAALLDDENIVKRKLDYLIKSMSHDTKLIAKSRALSFTLDHMKMRHAFLIRAGLFKPVPYARLIKVLEKEKASKNQRQKYFTPSEVVCYGDTQFLRACTKGALTINELAAFEEVFRLEQEKAIYDDMDEEDDDEDVSDNEDNLNCVESPISSHEFSKGTDGDHFYF